MKKKPNWIRVLAIALVLILTMCAILIWLQRKKESQYQHDLRISMMRTYSAYTANSVFGSDVFEKINSSNSSPNDWPEDPILPKARADMKAAIAEYNDLHAETQITYHDIANALGKNLKDIVSQKKQSEIAYMPEFRFLSWCTKEASLVYNEKDGTHNSGDPAHLIISNYDFARNKSFPDSAIKNLARQPGTGDD